MRRRKRKEEEKEKETDSSIWVIHFGDRNEINNISEGGEVSYKCGGEKEGKLHKEWGPHLSLTLTSLAGQRRCTTGINASLLNYQMPHKLPN